MSVVSTAPVVLTGDALSVAAAHPANATTRSIRRMEEEGRGDYPFFVIREHRFLKRFFCRYVLVEYPITWRGNTLCLSLRDPGLLL